MPEAEYADRLRELAHRSYETLATEGIDAWIDKLTTPDFVWDVTPMGLGRYEGRAAFREFYDDWTSSYDDWFIEPVGVEVLAPDVTLNAVRQGGRMRGSEQSVELRFAQIGVWEGSRLKRIANYFDLGEARAAARELVAAGRR